MAFDRITGQMLIEIQGKEDTSSHLAAPVPRDAKGIGADGRAQQPPSSSMSMALGSQSSRWNYVQSLSSYNLRNRTRVSANKVVGRTALMQAAMAGLVSDVEEMLGSSRLDLQDDMGMTALMWAACSSVYPPSKCQSSSGVMKLLLDARASVNIEDDNGFTVLMHNLSSDLDILNDPIREHEVEESKLHSLKLLLERRRGPIELIRT